MGAVFFCSLFFFSLSSGSEVPLQHRMETVCILTATATGTSKRLTLCAYCERNHRLVNVAPPEG